MSTLFVVFSLFEAFVDSETYRVLWKILWISLVLLAYYKRNSGLIYPRLLLVLMFLRALGFLLNVEGLAGSYNEWRMSVKYLIMPLAFIVAPLISRERWVDAFKLLVAMQLLWVFNLLPSSEDRLNIGSVGLSFVGSFGVPHLASISLAFIFLLFIYSDIKYLKYWSVLLLSLIVMTWVRTGLLIALVGIIFRYRLFTFRNTSRLLVLVLLTGVMLNAWISDELGLAIYNRIFDINYSGERIIGSGRLIFWWNSFEVWITGSPYSFFFGQGATALSELNFIDTGYRVYAHNEYFNTLSQNGLVGLLVLVGLNISLMFSAYRKRNAFLLTSSLAWVALNIVQGGIWFIPELIIGIAYGKHFYASKNI